MGCRCSITVADGKAIAVTERSGVVTVYNGPTQLYNKCGRTFEELETIVANESEYLEVRFRDGHTELIPGPTSLIQNPVEHAQIISLPALQIADQELIVVFRKSEESGPEGASKVIRTLIKGPALYIPSSKSEWVHEFVWTGPDNTAEPRNTGDLARKKVGALKFTKLRTIPGKMYFDVESVRTKDNAQITVKLMLFYKLINVEILLDNSNDPMAEFINSVTADIIQWCAPKKLDEFLESTDALNTLQPYKQLCSEAKKVGYEVASVVFRGYSAPPALQKMHDSAIEKRTALTLQKESEEEEQKLEDYKLQKQSERAAKEQQLALEKLNHEIALQTKQAEADQNVQKMQQAQDFQRLEQICSLDKKADNVWKYLTAKDCQMSPVYQCGTMLASDTQRR